MSDMIDRHEAIEAVCSVVMGMSDYPLTYAYEIAEEALEKLPSAEPEPMCINLNEPIKVKLTDWGKPIGDGRPLADSEVIPRLQDIKRQIGGSYAIERAIEVLEGLPSAEPEIIRCKDCRHGVDYYNEGNCYCSNPKYGLMYFGGSWEFYCADAERRTDE